MSGVTRLEDLLVNGFPNRLMGRTRCQGDSVWRFFS
jgi:hypothetical protein